MANKKKSNEKISFLGFDPVETPEEIIDKDSDIDRKKAFRDSYKVVMQRFADLFVNPKRKKTSTSGSTGGKAFTQNIIVTPEQVKIETNKESMQEEKQEEKERE